MRKSIALFGLAGASLLLSACGGSGLFNRARPDEFAVQRQAPLVIPPDFSLTPPAPGAPRPVDSGTAQQAQEALFGPAAPRSGVESADSRNPPRRRNSIAGPHSARTRAVSIPGSASQDQVRRTAVDCNGVPAE